MLLSLGWGCSEPPPPSSDPDKVTVAYLDGEPQSLAGLLEYLEDNLLSEEGDNLHAVELARVKSRLFDAFISERLLLSEARRREIKVTDLEVEAYLGVAVDREEETLTESAWNEARRRLMIQKLEEEVNTRHSPPQEHEIQAFIETHREGLAPEKKVRLRALRMPSPEKADEVYREISRKRITFDEAIAVYSDAEGQGVSLEVPWDSLWDEHRAALEGLKPGQTSRPVEMDGERYLLQLEARFEGGLDEEELAVLARRELEAEQRQQNHLTLLDKLRKKTRIQLITEALPFEYYPDDSGT